MMKRYTQNILGGVVAFALLVGCTAVNVDDSRSELISLYTAKRQADAGKDVVIASTIDNRFGEYAREQAKKAGESDGGNAVVYYYFATVAAKEAQIQEIVDYSDKGLALCSDQKVFAEETFECVMLPVIPLLAAVDETLPRYNEMTKLVGQGQRPETQAAVEIFNDLALLFEKLNSQRRKIATTNVSPDLKKKIDESTAEVFCRMQTSLGFVLTAAGDESPGFTSASQTFKQLKDSYDQAPQARC
jgi:hypothetical protein